MALTLLPSQLELAKKIAENESIKNFKLEISSGKQKGDGYMSNIILVSINSPEKTLKIVFKVASDSVKLRAQTPIDKAFVREIFMYKEVLNHFEKIQTDAEIPFTPTKFYGFTLKEYEECLALENLKENGFQLWNRKIPMNHEHIDLMFRTYAKYHALSFVTKYQYPDKYENWIQNVNNIRKDFVTESFDKQFRKLFVNISGLFEDERIKDKLITFAANWQDIYFTECEEKYAVIIHGDSWCNNFLFKYEDSTNTTKPTDIRLLDFQIALFTTPVHDLAYCLFSDTDKHCFNNYREYLTTYHNTMARVLEHYNLDINTVYPYEVLEQHWQKYAKYGLFMGGILLKAALVNTEDAVDMGELAENDCDVMESFMESLPKSEEYYERIRDLALFFLKNNLI